MASVTAWQPVEPRQSASAPARRAWTAASGMDARAVIAAMSSASVMTAPLKPSSRRSRPMSAGLSVAGASSSAGKRTCAVITAHAPACTAAANGTSSQARRPARPRWMVGRPRWESVRVSPCPGKCLAQAATPASCRPRTKAALWAATRAGSSPKERTPMTGLPGLEFTSTTGARFTLTPAAASARAMSAATR